MGIVMGTFSLPNKQVNYHKGKDFLITLDLRYFSVSTCMRLSDNLVACMSKTMMVSCKVCLLLTVVNIALKMHDGNEQHIY